MASHKIGRGWMGNQSLKLKKGHSGKKSLHSWRRVGYIILLSTNIHKANAIRKTSPPASLAKQWFFFSALYVSKLLAITTHVDYQHILFQQKFPANHPFEMVMRSNLLYYKNPMYRDCLTTHNVQQRDY